MITYRMEYLILSILVVLGGMGVAACGGDGSRGENNSPGGDTDTVEGPVERLEDIVEDPSELSTAPAPVVNYHVPCSPYRIHECVSASWHYGEIRTINNLGDMVCHFPNVDSTAFAYNFDFLEAGRFNLLDDYRTTTPGRFTIDEDPPFETVNHMAEGLNDHRTVVGHSQKSNGIGTPPEDRDYAFIWSAADGSYQLIASEANESHAFALNNSEQVVGDADGQAFIWDDTVGLTLLGPIQIGGGTSTLQAINENGAAAGYGEETPGGVIKPVIWDAASGFQTLETLPGTAGKAFGVNDGGDVVGQSDDGTGQMVPTIWWSDGTVVRLPLYANSGFEEPFDVGVARDVNNHGVVVGYDYVADEALRHWGRAWVWSAGNDKEDLLDQSNAPKPDDMEFVEFFHINDSGEIAGNLVNSGYGDRDPQGFKLINIECN